MNIDDEIIEEELVYASKLVNKFHLKKGHYTLQELCKELTKICFNAKFDVLEDKTKTKNAFEGTVRISSKQKIKDIQSLKYSISNKLAYQLGFITSWGSLFSKGLENSTQFYVIKNSQENTIEKEANIISHLTSLTISANFLKNQSAISYFSFSKEQLLQIMEDKLTLSQISQHDQNILHLPFYGMFCHYNVFCQNEKVW